MGIGIDIVKIERFKNVTERFIQKTFTPREQEYLKTRQAQSMAGIFAAKEAVVKALGTGFRGFWPTDVEIVHDSMGKPKVKLHGKARPKKRKGKARLNIEISITHSDTDAVAVAVLA